MRPSNPSNVSISEKQENLHTARCVQAMVSTDESLVKKIKQEDVAILTFDCGLHP